MNDAINHDGARYVFQVNEDEAMAFRRLLINNQKRYIRRSLTIGLPLLGFAGLMIPILIAQYAGALSVSAVLVAELAFAVGYLGLLISAKLAAHRLYRDLLITIKTADINFDCTFDDKGIIVKKGALETRATWDAISMVQDAGPIAAFWYDLTQGFVIPARVFSDAAAQASFVAWAAAHVTAAAASKTAR